jgi:hypothetical protein
VYAFRRLPVNSKTEYEISPTGVGPFVSGLKPTSLNDWGGNLDDLAALIRSLENAVELSKCSDFVAQKRNLPLPCNPPETTTAVDWQRSEEVEQRRHGQHRSLSAISEGTILLEQNNRGGDCGGQSSWLNVKANTQSWYGRAPKHASYNITPLSAFLKLVLPVPAARPRPRT